MNRLSMNRGTRKRTKPAVAPGRGRGRRGPALNKKPKKKAEEEEITSEEDDDEHSNAEKEEEEELSPDDGEGDESETEQEARIRLAKEQIQMLKKKLEASGRRRGGPDDDDDEDGIATTDQIAALLKDQLMEEQGKVLRKVVPESWSEEDSKASANVLAKGGKAMKSPLTCICITPTTVYVSTKSGYVSSYSLTSDGKRLAQTILKPPPVTSLSVSTTTLAASTTSAIHLLDPSTLMPTRVLHNSRNAVSLASSNETLYSAHKDRTVKVWDLNESAYVESLFGHQDVPTCVDVVGNERRIVSSGGFDKSLRVWKIDEESQLLYNWVDEDVIDVVKVLSGGFFVAGGISGSIGLFSFGRKRPVHVIKRAHGNVPNSEGSGLTDDQDEQAVPRWITALGGVGDLVASGSDDGLVKVWKVAARKLEFIREFDVGPGVVIGICVMGGGGETSGDSASNVKLIVGISTEMKNGRWAGRVGKQSRVVVCQ